MDKKNLTMIALLATFCFILSSCSNKGLAEEMDDAIQNQDVAKVKELLAKGVELEPPVQPNAINKPLAYAVQIGNIEIIEAIVEAGADINGQVAYYDTPLIIAFQSFNKDEIDNIAKYLIEQGADVNMPNAFGVSGFMGICGDNKIALAKLCIEKGADVNVKYKNITMEEEPYNFNALQWAVAAGHFEMTKLLLENGADPFLETYKGTNSFQLAKEQKHSKIVELLESYKK